MDPVTINAIGEIVGPAIALIVCGAFGLVCFPSIRAAFVERLRSRTLRHGEATDVVAQLNALRGEVYALRVEIAQVSHAVGAPPPPNAALPSGTEQTRTRS
jgi:hypothetical protein